MPLQIWGNALVPETTAEYIEYLAEDMIDYVTNYSSSLGLVNIDLNSLKHADKDDLEETLKVC